MKDFINFEKIEKLTAYDYDIPVSDKMIKLQEEVGEAAQAYLGWKGAKNASASASGDIMELVEEICDTINVSINILNHLETQYNVPSEDIKKMFQSKLDKWESKTGKSRIKTHLFPTNEVYIDITQNEWDSLLKNLKRAFSWQTENYIRKVYEDEVTYYRIGICDIEISSTKNNVKNVIKETFENANEILKYDYINIRIRG